MPSSVLARTSTLFVARSFFPATTTSTALVVCRIPGARMASTKQQQQQQQQQPQTSFGPYKVTTQVFHRTAHSFALVNIKPLLPGHVLVCPVEPHRRLTELSAAELTDLFTAVQRVQRMLARRFFLPAASSHSPSSSASSSSCPSSPGGSFNIAVQDGPEAGQTVPHVHVHVIPRPRHSPDAAAPGAPDELYECMADERGNVGGALWDARAAAAAAARPVPGGAFPPIEDADRKPRSMAEMEAEAAEFRRIMEQMREEEEEEEEAAAAENSRAGHS